MKIRLFGKPRQSAAEAIEDRLMREWIQPDEFEMNKELGDDDYARELIKTHKLYVAFNSHASEPRWEVSSGEHRCYSNEYSQPLGDAIRECVAKMRP